MSNGSDLDVILVCNSSANLSLGQTSRGAEDIHLFMYGVKMLKPYIDNIRTIYAELQQPDIVQLLAGLLSELGPTSRLTQLRLRSTKTPDFHNAEDEEPDCFSGNVECSQDLRRPKPPSCVDSLAVLDVSGLPSWDVIPIPQNLDHLSMGCLDSGSPLVDWKQFHTLMKPLIHLRSMQVDLRHFHAGPSRTGTAGVVLPQLRVLSLVRVCYELLDSFIGCVHLPNLHILRLLSGFVRPTSNATYTDASVEGASPPSLGTSSYEDDSARSSQFTPTATCVPGGNAQRRLQLHHTLDIKGVLDPDSVIQLLGVIDIKEIENMQIHLYPATYLKNNGDDSQKSTTTTVSTSAKFQLPYLRRLEVHSPRAGDSVRLLSRLGISHLTSFEDNHWLKPEAPAFREERALSISRCVALTQLDQLKGLNDITVDIPRFDREFLKHPFTSLPHLERLTFFLDNGRNEGCMEWSGMEWLCSPSRLTTGTQSEPPLRNLRHLHLKISREVLKPDVLEAFGKEITCWCEKIAAWRTTHEINCLETVQLLGCDFETWSSDSFKAQEWRF